MSLPLPFVFRFHLGSVVVGAMDSCDSVVAPAQAVILHFSSHMYLRTFTSSVLLCYH
jgi:hypothetical protein